MTSDDDVLLESDEETVENGGKAGKNGEKSPKNVPKKAGRSRKPGKGDSYQSVSYILVFRLMSFTSYLVFQERHCHVSRYS